MAWFDLFRSRVAGSGTTRAARHQQMRQHARGRRLAALPMNEFVPECLRKLNQCGGAWTAHSRPPHPDARTLASHKNLPNELADFYCMCDGFESPQAGFPAPVLPIASLALGAECRPALSQRLAAYWAAHGNPSGAAGLLAVLPDTLMAADTHDTHAPLHPAVLNLALPLCPPRAADFVVLLLADDPASGLPRGTVVQVKTGAATRYPGFKAWLGSRAAHQTSTGD